MRTKYLSAGLLLLFSFATQAQVLNRLKQRVENNAEQKAGQEIDKLFSGKRKIKPGKTKAQTELEGPVV